MKLLIYSPDSFSLFFPDTRYIFGGAELRAWKFAKGLSRNNSFEVHVITADHAKKKCVTDKISIWPHPEKKGQGYWEKRKTIAGRIGHRLGRFSPAFPALNSLLDYIAPDIILVFGMSPDAWKLMHYADSHDLVFVFGCASDLDLSESYLAGSGKDVSGNSCENYKEILQRAACVLVQTPEQLSRLESSFGRNGELLLNPVSIPTGKNKEDKFSQADVLWIGKSSPLKRPDVFLRLAAANPQYSFRMVMNKTDEVLYAKCMREKSLNVEILNAVPFQLIPTLFRASRIFVNTSSVEGFANTFLQAAAENVPVVSMNADPNGMISRHGAGLFTGDDETKLSAAVLRLLQDEKLLTETGIKARRYVEAFHEEGRQVKLLGDILVKYFVNSRILQ